MKQQTSRSAVVRPQSPNRFDKYWTSRSTFSTTLLVILLDTYGVDALSWDPSTIQMEIEGDGGLDIPAENIDKIMCAIDVLKTNNFEASLPDFIRTCLAFSGQHVDEGMFAMADASDCAWGLTEAWLISPPEDEKNALSPEILGYIGHVCDDEGLLNPPDILRLGSSGADILNKARYNLSDDIDTFSAFTDYQQGKTEEINGLVSGRLKGLFAQIQKLEITTGNKTKMLKLIEKMQKVLPENQDPFEL